MKRFIALSVTLPGLLALGACAHAVQPTQLITIETPGAEGAICFLERPGFRQRIWAPQTVRVEKTEDTLGITCRASGNREQTVVIDPVKDRSAEWGDYFPRKVLVDFRNVQLRTQQLPAQEFVPVPAPAAPPDSEYRTVPVPPPSADMYETLPPASGSDLSLEQDHSAPAPLYHDFSRQTAPPPPADNSGSTWDGGDGAWDGRHKDGDTWDRNAEADSSSATVTETSPAPPPEEAAWTAPATAPPVPTSGASSEELTKEMNPEVFSPPPLPPAQQVMVVEQPRAAAPVYETAGPTPVLPPAGAVSTPE